MRLVPQSAIHIVHLTKRIGKEEKVWASQEKNGGLLG